MPGTRKHLVRVAGVLSIAFVSGIVSGCAAQSSAEADATEWREPEWFAQVRSYWEYGRNWFAECLAEYGVVGDEVIGSGLATVTSGPEKSPEEHEARSAALWACSDRYDYEVPENEQPFSDEPIGEAAYLRMLDTRECVIHNGFDIPEPPPMDNWIAMQGRWGAFGVINPSLTREEAIALNDACPQFGWGSFNWQDPTRFDFD